MNYKTFKNILLFLTIMLSIISFIVYLNRPTVLYNYVSHKGLEINGFVVLIEGNKYTVIHSVNDKCAKTIFDKIEIEKADTGPKTDYRLTCNN